MTQKVSYSIGIHVVDDETDLTLVNSVASYSTVWMSNTLHSHFRLMTLCSIVFFVFFYPVLQQQLTRPCSLEADEGEDIFIHFLAILRREDVIYRTWESHNNHVCVTGELRGESAVALLYVHLTEWKEMREVACSTHL